jgi:hypothetical protein
VWEASSVGRLLEPCGIFLILLIVVAAQFALETAVLLHGKPVLQTGAAAIYTMPPLIAAIIAVTYLLMRLALVIVTRIFTYQRVWKRVVGACAVIGTGTSANFAAEDSLPAPLGRCSSTPSALRVSVASADVFDGMTSRTAGR